MPRARPSASSQRRQEAGGSDAAWTTPFLEAWGSCWRGGWQSSSAELSPGCVPGWAALSPQQLQSLCVQADVTFSGARAGLLSADMLRREQQELRRQERSTRHLEGRGVSRALPAVARPLLSALLRCCIRPQGQGALAASPRSRAQAAAFPGGVRAGPGACGRRDFSAGIPEQCQGSHGEGERCCLWGMSVACGAAATSRSCGVLSGSGW